MGGGKKCAVVGCENKTQQKDKHFYKFPSDPQLRNIWMQFTRRGDDFVLKNHVICEDHFKKSCFAQKKRQLRLKEGTAPTIFERLTKDGKKRIKMNFDPDLVAYLNSETLLDPVYDKEEHGKKLVKEQQARMKEVKKYCRFCLEDKAQDEENLIPIKKLEDYYIKLNEVFTIVGLDRKYDGIFGEEICEECFQGVITFDGFRKRCCKSQNAVVIDLKELDQKVRSVLSTITQYSKYFYDVVETNKEPEETNWEDDGHVLQNDSTELKNQISPLKTENVCVPFHNITIKQEANDASFFGVDEYESYQFTSNDIDYDDSNDFPLLTVEEPNIEETPKTKANFKSKLGHNLEFNPKSIETQSDDDFNWKEPEELPVEKKKKSCGKSEFSLLVDDDTVVKDNKQQFANRIYECWFCRLKFAGKKTFKKHDCPVKTMKCPIEKCEKVFKVMSGYNQHIVHLHKLPKLNRIYCKICKLSMIATDQEYRSHLRKCEINSNNLSSTHSVKCEVCHKVCPNIQSYSIHMLFHKPGDVKKEPSQKKDPKGTYICETCGKDFQYQRYLAHHIKRLHSKPVANPTIYTCDHCGKTRTNRATLSKHIRNVHRSEPTPCGICGKVFRNRSLMQAHMIYHKDSKRIHFCSLCPDKPPYVTAVALRRHQESNHGYGPGYRCEICDSNYRTKASLKQHVTTVHKNSASTSALSYWQ